MPSSCHDEKPSDFMWWQKGFNSQVRQTLFLLLVAALGPNGSLLEKSDSLINFHDRFHSCVVATAILHSSMLD